MDKEKILALYKAGRGIKFIAKELNTYPNAIKRILIKTGIYNAPFEDRVTANINEGDKDRNYGHQGKATDNSLCEQINIPATRGPEHCSKWQTCGVCQMEPDKRKMLEEMYIQGFPDAMLYTYFALTPGDLASHAWLKHWYTKRKKHEDPSRKKAERESLSREIWRTIVDSKSEGTTGDRIAALKLLAQMQGLLKEGNRQQVQVNIWEGIDKTRQVTTQASEIADSNEQKQFAEGELPIEIDYSEEEQE